MPFDLAWFVATLFGFRFACHLTEEQYAFARGIAEDELKNVLCWCPKMYPQALSIKIALILDGAGLGLVPSAKVDICGLTVQCATNQPAAPNAAIVPATQEAFVIEDEVYDVRRKYKLFERPKQLNAASPVGILQGIIDRCKPPLRIGATLARGMIDTFGCCGANGDPIGDKAEWNHGGQ